MAKTKGQQKHTASASLKVPQVLVPNARLFLAFLILFAVATFIFTENYWLAIAEGAVILALIV